MGKIKILQYTGGMNRAGAETLLMDIYRNIDRDKYEFHFVSHINDKCDYDDEIIKLGGRIIYIERPSIRNIKKYKKSFKSLISENGPYNALHCHMQLINGIILKYAKETGIKKRICHAHLNGDYNKDGLLRNIYRCYSKHLIKNYSTKNLACSTESGKYLYNGRNFLLLNNAIDLDKFDMKNKANCYIKEELGLDENIKIMTHVGRFVEAKNHKLIVKIFSEVIKRDKGYRLLLCGEGYLESSIKKLVKRLNIGSYVYFLGIRSDINKILLSTDVFLMPSILEGLPVALVEAQAAGCSCIISKNIPEEADLNIGVVERISLEEEISVWVERILNKDNKRIEFNIRKEKIKGRGFDLANNISILRGIYD